jgi:hypothetical protein
VTTLTIKNESGAKIEFATPGGAVSLDPGASAELNEKQLRSGALADALYAGKLSVTPKPNPTKEQIALARAVLPPLVTGADARLIQLRTRFDQAQAELVKLRTAFNKTWKVADSSLGAAKDSAVGWPGLRKAVKGFILDTETEDPGIEQKREALEALEEELTALKQEDLSQTGRTLEAWYADRVAKEQTVKEATEALAEVTKAKANPLVAQVDAVDARVGQISGITPATAIGEEIPAFGQ